MFTVRNLIRFVPKIVRNKSFNSINYNNHREYIDFTRQLIRNYRTSTLVWNSVKDKTIVNTDGLSVGGSTTQQIYYGTLTPKIKAVKIFSITTSLTGLAAQPILIEQGAKIGGTPMVLFLCTFVGFFTFVTPFILHFITKKYVTEIRYNEENKEYIATTITFFLRKQTTQFRVDDIKVPEIAGMFTSFSVGKKALFVDPVMFTDTKHYIKMMGYDKPIDFKMGIPDKNTTKP